MTTALADLDDATLKTVGADILNGVTHPYDEATRGVGHSIELIVAEIERLREVIQSGPNNKGKNLARARLRALIAVGQSVGQDLVAAASMGRDLSEQQVRAIGTWCSFVSLAHDPEFNEIACDLHFHLRPFQSRLLNLVSATAVAVTSSFRTPRDGLRFWEKYLFDNSLPNYAVDYFIKHQPSDPRLEASIIRLWQGALLDFVDVSAESLVLKYCERQSALGPDPRGIYVERILNQIPRTLLPTLISRIDGRKRFAEMQRIAQELQAAPTRVVLDPALSDWLRSIEVNPDDFSPSANYPDEIKVAINEYLAGSESLRIMGKLPETELRRYEYPTQFRIRSEAHDDLESRLSGMFTSARRTLGDLRALSGSQIPELDSRLASRAKVLLQVAFFFQTESRRQDKWGVIPLGRQRAFGMVIHKSALREEFKVPDTPQGLSSIDQSIAKNGTENDQVARQLGHLQEKHKGDIIGSSWDSKASLEFVDRIFKLMDRDPENCFYVREGFVMDDLLIEMLTQHRPQLVPLAHRRVKSVSLESEHQFKMFPVWDFDHKIDGDSERYRRSVALFDLGRLPQVLQGMHGPTFSREFEKNSGKSDFVVAILKHGLDVPVGVGFSLPLLPYLFVRSNWQNGSEQFLFEAIRSVTAQTLLQSLGESWPEMYEGIGIDLSECRQYAVSAGNVVPMPNRSSA